jgi:hypothetical protein
MKFYNVTSLFEAVANQPLDTQSTTFDQNLKIIRVIDYLTTGIDSGFSDESTQAGGSELAGTREGGRGAYSKHKDYCLSCVNMIVTNAGKDAFSGLSYEDVLVPRIPLEYMGDEENVDEEWAFIESCDAVRNNFSDRDTIQLSTSDVSASSIFGMDSVKKITKNTKFYKSSLLFGYVIDEQKITYTNGDEEGVISLKSKILNLDPEMKYMDEEIEKNRPLAIKFLKKVLELNPDNLNITNDNSGEAKNDLMSAPGATKSTLEEAKSPNKESTNTANTSELLVRFKQTVPEDGNVFLSPNEIKDFIPLFEYVRVDGAQNDEFFGILSNGMQSLEDEGVHFGDNLNVAGDVQNVLMQGNYDLVVGYSQAGDTTHTKQFNNKGEEIFVGYVTNYKDQKDDAVIPVYFTTTNKSTISNMESKKGTPLHVNELKNTKTSIPFKKLNTSGVAKRMGGNEIIFQLPIEIYSKAGQEVAQSVTPEENKTSPEIPTEPITPESKKSTRKPKEKTSGTKAPAESTKTNETPTATKEETPGGILKRIGANFKAGTISRDNAILAIKNEIKSKLNKDISLDKIQASFDKLFSSDKPRGENEIRRDDQYSTLLGPDVRNTKLAKSALERVKSLAQLGHKFTPEEVSNLVSRGLNQADVDSVIKKYSIMEVRISPSSFNMKALMENLNSKKK